MFFYIITPSINQLSQLKRCVASVRDQSDIGGNQSHVRDLKEKGMGATKKQDHTFFVHHHVQDGKSTDGTVEWLRTYQAELRRSQSKSCRKESHLGKEDGSPAYTFSFSSERDEGMYDALNRALDQVVCPCLNDAKREGELVWSSWLNCDEQYFPDTLLRVAHHAMSHPGIQLAYGDSLLVSDDGSIVTVRKNPPLRLAYVLADHLYVQSAGLFFDASLFGNGLRFNSNWKAVGDWDIICHLLRMGIKVSHLPEFVAACAMTGRNLSCQDAGIDELRRARRSVPFLYRLARPLLNGLRHTEKLFRGGYFTQRGLDYQLFVEGQTERKRFHPDRAGVRFRWGTDE